MSERLWTAALTAEQLAAWLAPPRTEAPFAILEQLTELDFPASDESIEPADWEQGRIFGAAFELRWERQGESYRAWLTGKKEAPDFEALPLLDETTMSAPACCYLWGADEARIARRLRYRALPEGEGRVQLIRHEFRRPDGALAHYRFAAMRWEKIR